LIKISLIIKILSILYNNNLEIERYWIKTKELFKDFGKKPNLITALTTAVKRIPINAHIWAR